MKIELTIKRSERGVVQAEAVATVRGRQYLGAASAGLMQTHISDEEAAQAAVRYLLRAVKADAVLDE